MIIGRRAVLDALSQGKALEKILLFNKAVGAEVGELRKAAAHHQVPINYVPIEKINGFNIENHEGCVAIISKVQYQDLQQVISWVVEGGNTPLFLILDGITDIRNIGAIARTAYATGVQAIIIPEKGVGTLNEDAILTSAGALEKLAVCRVPSLMKAVDELHLNGIRVVASEMKATDLIYDLDLAAPVAVIMGGEEKGVFAGLLKISDQQFQIPMANEFESLNVSVATGMILYEAMKQRRNR